MAKPNRVLTEKEIGLVSILAGHGLTVEKIAHILDSSKATLERIMKRDKRVHEAILKGRARAEADVADSLYRMATTGKNVTAAIFWLKCRAQWRDPNVIRHEGIPVAQGDTNELIIDLSGKYAPTAAPSEQAKKKDSKDDDK